MEQMKKKNPLSDMMQDAMGKVREMVDSNTIVGQPITVDGVTLIPISKVSFGFGGGGGEFSGKANAPEKNLSAGVGAGVKINPVAFLIVKDGSVRMMPVAVPATGAVDRLIEMMPDAIDKVSSFISSRKGASVEEDIPVEPII